MKPVGVFDSGFGGVSFLKKSSRIDARGELYILWR